MKERKLFLLVNEDLEGIVFSTKGSRPGYCSSKKPSINYDYLSKIGVQPDIPYSMLEYNRRVSEIRKFGIRKGNCRKNSSTSGKICEKTC